MPLLFCCNGEKLRNLEEFINKWRISNKRINLGGVLIMGKEQKIKYCKSCGKELDKSAKICPKCGKDQRSFFGKHKIVTGILAIIILCIVGAIFGGKEDTTPEGQISASDLTLAYDRNEVKADKEYTDKYYEVTGVVSDIDITLGSPYVVLEGEESNEVNWVEQSDAPCFFDKNDEEQMDKLSELKKGDTITVIGKIDGKSANVGIVNAKVK